MLTLAGTLLVVVVGVAPAAAAGAGLVAALWLLIAEHGVPFGAALASAVMFAEAHVATMGLGRLFDRYDVTT